MNTRKTSDLSSPFFNGDIFSSNQSNQKTSNTQQKPSFLGTTLKTIATSPTLQNLAHTFTAKANRNTTGKAFLNAATDLKKKKPDSPETASLSESSHHPEEENLTTKQDHPPQNLGTSLLSGVDPETNEPYAQAQKNWDNYRNVRKDA